MVATPVGPNEKIYSVSKLAAIVDSLGREGIAPSVALRGVQLAGRDLHNSVTRVSLNQIVRVCRGAAALSRDPHFAYHTGIRVHLSTYGLYGFAILSCTSLRQAIAFGLSHYQLAIPLVDTSCHEERRRVVWTLFPIEGLDARLYRFILELELAILLSLHRDCIGPAFAPSEVHLPFAAPRDSQVYPQMLRCPVLFGQPDARLIYDSKWLDTELQFGNELAHSELVTLCYELLREMHLRIGIAGKVRGVLLANRMVPMSFEALARELHMSGRTLRRKLRDERTSFRKIWADLRTRMALKYLRDTELTIDQIAQLLGFSESGSFRRAFRRWTDTAPLKLRKRNRIPARARLRR